MLYDTVGEELLELTDNAILGSRYSGPHRVHWVFSSRASRLLPSFALDYICEWYVSLTSWVDFPHLLIASVCEEPPSGQLRLASPNTINLATSIFRSVASDFPSKYLSTGGDELNLACYSQDKETQAELKASGQTLEQALNTFTQATHSALRQAGKTPVVWEEMVLNHNVTLSNDTIAMKVPVAPPNSPILTFLFQGLDILAKCG